MAENTDAPPTPTTRTHRLAEKSFKNSTKYNFRIQSAPPLSLQQFLRSATGVSVGSKQWQPSGRYRPSPFHAYLSPAVKARPKIAEPVWSPSSAYKDKRPTSLSPEKRPQKSIEEPVWRPPSPYVDKRPSSLSPEKRPRQSIQEPVWQPPGKIEHKPVPYFDPPNLRWSLQELLRSMPEMRPKSSLSSRSMSRLRKSATVENT